LLLWWRGKCAVSGRTIGSVPLSQTIAFGQSDRKSSDWLNFGISTRGDPVEFVRIVLPRLTWFFLINQPSRIEKVEISGANPL
jgi:hypothetical protein